jgi:hypothetical protein
MKKYKATHIRLKTTEVIDEAQKNAIEANGFGSDYVFEPLEPAKKPDGKIKVNE